MTERRKYSKDELITVLEEVSKHLVAETTVYLIGGLGMVLHGYKAITRDVDIVFDSDEDLKRFITAAEKAGMKSISDKSAEYVQLGPQHILENQAGIRLDIFYKQVCNGLILSEDMKQRAQTKLEFHNLTVHAMSGEDIFLFKSITLRDDDLADMASIAAMELDWNTIYLEIRKQPNSEEWFPRVRERLMELKDEYGVDSPLI
ncbi:MAG: hypothetical protein KAJ33_00865 [Thermoplasmata archaeon]|nr:hypothetical protein [Thermoplasmata archaeon]